MGQPQAMACGSLCQQSHVLVSFLRGEDSSRLCTQTQQRQPQHDLQVHQKGLRVRWAQGTVGLVKVRCWLVATVDVEAARTKQMILSKGQGASVGGWSARRPGSPDFGGQKSPKQRDPGYEQALCRPASDRSRTGLV